MTKWLSVVAVCTLLSQSVSALAQDAESPTESETPRRAPAPASAPPDVVVTKAGAMVRGTISEKDPEGDVTIQTMTGTMRRFSMRDVSYAGPADGMPKPKPARNEIKPKAQEPNADAAKYTAEPKIQVRSRKVPLTLQANLPDVTFHLKTGSANFDGVGSGSDGDAVALSGITQAYSVICTAPCEAVLPTGTHRMALSLNGGRAVEDEEPITLDGAALVNGKYTSNQGLRTAGVVVGIGATLGGTILMFSGLPSTDDPSEDKYQTEFYLGGALIGVGLITWLALGLRKDVAEISVLPVASNTGKRTVTRASTHNVRFSPSGLLF